MNQNPHQSFNQLKYNSKNPFKKFLLKRFIQTIIEVTTSLHPSNILDIGCGEALLLKHLHQYLPETKLVGIDLSNKALSQAKKNTPSGKYINMNAQKLNFKPSQFDLTLAIEILEHIPKPASAIKQAHKVSKKYCLFSVPHEPWFSLLSLASGMYIKRLGKHPEHINFWTAKNFQNLISKEFNHIKIYHSFPWLIVLGIK